LCQWLEGQGSAVVYCASGWRDKVVR